MQQLLYFSSTYRDPAQEMLDDILASARRNNELLNVTSMLLYADGGFLQVLEGEEKTLTNLYAKIREDKRHWDAQLLLRHDGKPAFQGWSMGFHRLSESGDEMFQISADAIGGRLNASEHTVLLRLMANFYRIQTGEDRFPGRGL